MRKYTVLSAKCNKEIIEFFSGLRKIFWALFSSLFQSWHGICFFQYTKEAVRCYEQATMLEAGVKPPFSLSGRR